MSDSQRAEILAYLKSGESITPKDALQLFGCMRLAARIKDLRDDGHDIQMAFEDNGTSRYARYSLARKPVQLGLLFPMTEKDPDERAGAAT